MDLKISDQLFIVTGASSGLGHAVASTLIDNGAKVIAVARRREVLQQWVNAYPEKLEMIVGDVLEAATLKAISRQVNGRELAGVFVNAGGPPAMSFEETSLKNWDEAYRLLLRWKADLIKQLLPLFKEQGYGRILFSESSTLKQPIENLVLSNSLRMAVAGMAKTLSQEVAADGITVNIIGPGFHETAAIDRLFKKKSELEGISIEQARQKTLDQIPGAGIGNPDDFASLAAWLLSPLSGFVTGQIFTLDGGSTRHSLG
ncbi:MAG: SDR family oxidoreductase [Bacteroidota bacterium]